MNYSINRENIIAAAEKEISRVASSAVDEQGQLLYDYLRVTSRDTETLSDYLDDAIGEIVARLHDITVRHANQLIFHVPDFDATFDNDVNHALNRYLSLAITAFWLEEKGNSNFEVYGNRAKAMLGRASILLKTRKAPERNI